MRPSSSLLLVAGLAFSVCAAPPAPSAAQLPATEPAPAPAPTPLLLEQYLSRAQLDPAITGAPARVGGAGARLLRPLAAHDDGAAAPTASRLAVGAFATYARRGDPGLTAWHYGAQADLRLGARPLGGRVEPLLSLGVGALRTRHESDCGALPPVRDACPPRAGGRVLAETAPAVSPALGVRVGLLPGLALRSEVRDVIVYQGTPRHTLELATGISLARWRAPR
jgi:hypothetical protein